jgi:hypothetical protein
VVVSIRRDEGSVFEFGTRLLCFFESMAVGVDQLGRMTGGKAACLEAGGMFGLPW